MPSPREKVGFIFECGRDGPDYRVCRHFMGQLNPAIDMVPRFLDNKPQLLAACGDVADRLLRIDACTRVVVTWDLEPAWGGQACRRRDRELALRSLRDARVQMQQVLLLCIVRELECWLMADSRALEIVIGRFTHPHRPGRMPVFRRPDDDIERPKTELISLFRRELGATRKYVDRDHALLLAQSIPDWSKLRRSDSFRRFAEGAACVTLL